MGIYLKGTPSKDALWPENRKYANASTCKTCKVVLSIVSKLCKVVLSIVSKLCKVVLSIVSKLCKVVLSIVSKLCKVVLSIVSKLCKVVLSVVRQQNEFFYFEFELLKVQPCWFALYQ